MEFLEDFFFIVWGHEVLAAPVVDLLVFGGALVLVSVFSDDDPLLLLLLVVGLLGVGGVGGHVGVG